MADYPAELVEHWQGGGETLTIRPIRPDDAASTTAFLSSAAARGCAAAILRHAA